MDGTKSNQSARAISGITCQVTGCKYHEPGDKCFASNISVETPGASAKTDTYCGTFAPNSGC